MGDKDTEEEEREQKEGDDTDSGGTGGGFYMKFDKNDKVVIDKLTITSYLDAEPKLVTDNETNAHITYMNGIDQDVHIFWACVYPNGTIGEGKRISKQASANI